MDKKEIFFVEDDPDISELIRFNLTLKGYNVFGFSTGESLLSAFGSKRPDLILLDLMLPDMGGLDLCRKIKQNLLTQKIPIIIVSAKGDEGDIVKGLEMGADDYVTKPFGPKILLARVDAVLRRISLEKQENNSSLIPSSSPQGEETLSFQDLQVNLGRREVKIKDEFISLTRSEFQILYVLVKRPGWVFTRSQIVDAIHGENYSVTDRTIDFQMVGLRKKIGVYGAHIETVRGIGYRFRDFI